MFLEEVADLKDRWPDRFQLVPVLSREEQQAGLPTGRLDAERLTALLPALLPVAAVDGWYLCGPLGLVTAAEQALRALGVPRSRVHQEIFHVDEVARRRSRWPGRAAAAAPCGRRSTAGAAAGRRRAVSRCWRRCCATVPTPRTPARAGCAGRAGRSWSSGEVRMDRNFALEPEETEAGYVLACQSHPVTPWSRWTSTPEADAGRKARGAGARGGGPRARTDRP